MSNHITEKITDVFISNKENRLSVELITGMAHKLTKVFNQEFAALHQRLEAEFATRLQIVQEQHALERKHFSNPVVTTETPPIAAENAH